VAYPEHVEKLVFIGVNRAPPEARRQAVRDRVAKVRAEGLDAIVDTVVKGGVSPHTLANKPEVVAFVRELLLRQPPEGYARSCEAMAASTAADVGAIKAPVLLIAGRDDGVSPVANSEGMAADLANAQLRILEQCGHWHPIEQPAAVAQALREFL
jgi:pimeloyl-ACP methyl ester carboxylesterase